MKNHTKLRAIGLLAVVIAYSVFTTYGMKLHPLLAVLFTIVALVSPEVLERLPWGPKVQS